MWNLVFTGDLLTGYRRDEVVANLAKLLQKAPDEVRSELFSGEAVNLRQVTDEQEASQWRRRFASAGALILVVPADEETPGGSRFAGTDPANRNIEEPTIASVFARVPAVRRRNQAYAFLGMVVLASAIIFVVVLKIFQ